LIAQQAQQQTLATSLANSPAGYDAQKKLREQQFNMQMQQEVAYAQRQGATADQIEMLKLAKNQKYNDDEMAAEQAHENQMITMANSNAKRKEAAAGHSPAALALRQQQEQTRFNMELQTRIQHAQREGLTEKQIDQVKVSAEVEHKAKMVELNQKYYDDEAKMLEKSGDHWGAFLARRNSMVAQEGSVMGNLHAVQGSQYYKAEDQMLTDVSSLRSSHSKAAFEMGKKAAIAQATIHTFESAVSAFNAMASIPIVGPALGAVAAAAAIAAGMNNISQISSQKFSGQADEGMDSIPQGLNGKSFLLSAGERVVQPQANKDLTEFLNKEKMNLQGGGSRSGSGAITINLTYSGGMNKEDVKKMADMLIPEIRARSERGTQIINAKGVTNG
jgi:hypothetical protein